MVGEAPALHALLGLSPDVTVADLRAAYDRAMAMAVRMGDHQRALTLSQAFDALPSGLHRQVYPAVAHRRAPADTLVAPPRRGRSPAPIPRRHLPRRAGRPRMSRARRLTLVALAAVVIAVPLGVVVGLHWKQWTSTPGDANRRPADITGVIVQHVP